MARSKPINWNIIEKNFESMHDLRIDDSNYYRYVFFKSLPFNCFQVYDNLYQLGKNYVLEASNILQGKNTSIIDYGERIKKYVEFVYQIYQQELANEKEFVKNYQTILKDDRLKELSPFFMQFVENMDKEFNYFNLIGAINAMLKDNNQLNKKQDELIKNNMDLITKNYNQAVKENEKEYKDLSKESYEQYLKKVSPLLKPIINESGEIVQKYEKYISSLYAQKFNSIFSQISSNLDFSNIILDAWINSTNWNESYITKATAALVANELLNMSYDDLKNKEAEEITKYIVNNYNNLMSKMSEEEIDRIINIINPKIIKSIEELALTTSVSLGKLFLQLTSEEQQDIFNRYNALGKYSFSSTFIKKTQQALRKKYGNTLESAQKRQEALISAITKKLRAAIRYSAEKTFGQQFKRGAHESYDKLKAQITNLIKTDPKAKDFFKLRKSVTDCFKIKISGPSAKEYFAAKGAAGIKALIELHGNKIQLKTDISVTFTYEPLDLEQFDEQDQKKLTNIVNNWHSNFIKKYNTFSQGTINVEDAFWAFYDMQDEIKKTVDELAKISKDKTATKEQLLQALNNYVNASISVKEYVLAMNETAFSGGSLGANVEKQIANIDKMYELGGLTHADRNLLQFVALNCGEDGLASGLKTHLEHYLLAGAAMIMFDDGFATAEKFMEDMKKEFGFIPKIMHLYHVQNTYIPASVVYGNIYNKLLEIYKDIKDDLNTIDNIPFSQNYLTIDNPINEDHYGWNQWVNHKNDNTIFGEGHIDDYNDARDRWNKVSQDARGISDENFKINLRFAFLGGVLDILKQIPQTFQNPI